MKTAAILWLSLGLVLQVDILQAGPVNVASEDLGLGTEEEVNELELSGSGMDVEQIDEEYINSKLPKEIRDRLDLYGGDILLTPEQKEEIKEMEKQQAKEKEGGVEKRAVVTVRRDLWPNAVVYYTISSSLRSVARNAINAAIAEYERKTCIRFVPRTSQRDYVYFIADDGCYSYIGRTGGRQEISIDRGCEYRGIVLHEIFHALGRWHEQSRPDRDSFVRINYQNIRREEHGNFEKLSSSEASTNNIAYDYHSLMHYGAYDFSRNRRPAIEPIDSRVSLSALGQRSTLSDQDLQHALNLYCGGQGTWSAWTQWSSCSVTCGLGRQTRTRTCNGGNCAGSSSETRVCNTNRQCPRWGSWSSWSVCSVSCGTGIERRTRTCLGGSSCSGSSSQTRVCSVDCSTWSSWSSWGPCSVTCGSGSQERIRTCQGGNSCVGSTRDTRTCNTNVQCLRWSSWSSWSTCSKTCGTGQQHRTRSCTGTGSCPGSGFEVRTCNDATCPGVWTGWSDWGSCSKECGAGTQTRTRDCVGGVCSGEDTQERDCVKTPVCLSGSGQWGTWGSWSQCSRSCGFGGTQFRTRTCSFGSCVGANKEIQNCNIRSCPNQLGSSVGWGEWTEWGDCSRTCGGGFKIRRRTCLNWPCTGWTWAMEGCNYDNCPTPAPPQPVTVVPSAEPFTARVHTRLSCKQIDIEAGVLELHTLNEDPLTSDIVQGCINLAATNGFKFVGVAGGFCISGSNTETHYTQLPDSTSCTGGTGSFSATSLLAHMDVYRITPA